MATRYATNGVGHCDNREAKSNSNPKYPNSTGAYLTSSGNYCRAATE